MNKLRRKKILIYAPTPPPYAGPEVATQMLLQNLPNEKIETVYLRSNVRSDNAKKGVMDLEGILAFGKLYVKFLSTIIYHRPDTVYLLLSSGKTGFLRDAVLIRTVTSFRRKVIVHYRGGNFHRFFEQQTPTMRKIIVSTMKQVSRVIVQAEILKEMFSEVIVPENISVLYNGLEESLPIERRKDPARAFTILFMGHLSYAKGFYDLIEAYKILREQYPVRLIFAGTPFMRAASESVTGFLSGEALKNYTMNRIKINEIIEEFVSNPGKYNAEYLGVISGEKKITAFSDADAFVLPSYTEGFSMAVLEAMSYGLPVVVTPVGAFPEVIKSKVNGIFVGLNSPGEICKALEDLIQLPDKAMGMGANNQHEVFEKYSVQVIAKQFEEILANV